ncbi:hypothetical protein AS590_28240 [Prescottella equi]|nr:hypothetical protein EHW12_14620 [Rhodococcus sp. NJ-530]EME24632.1 hypothetical protein G418_05527 [Rhodococcus qingshengii BKS 20-40]OCC19826.1 hypothetical protein AS590_28240 [Prescottella equi]
MVPAIETVDDAVDRTSGRASVTCHAEATGGGVSVQTADPAPASVRALSSVAGEDVADEVVEEMCALRFCC